LVPCSAGARGFRFGMRTDGARGSCDVCLPPSLLPVVVARGCRGFRFASK